MKNIAYYQIRRWDSDFITKYNQDDECDSDLYFSQFWRIPYIRHSNYCVFVNK
jgi:hypothetical protein